MKTLRSYAATLAICIAVHGAENEQDQVLLVYQERPIHCRELVGRTYEEGLAIARRFDANRRSITSNDGGSYLPPSVSPWKAEQPSFVKYYHHQLNGVIEIFIKYQVMKGLETSYSLERNPLFDRKKLEQAAQREIKLRHNCTQTLAAGILAKDQPEAILARLRANIPVLDDSLTDPAEITGAIELPGQYAFTAKAFPAWIKNKPAPWVDMSYLMARYRYHIEFLAQEHRDRIEKQLSTYTAALIHNVSAGSQKSALALMRTLIGKDGTVAKAGVAKVNRVWKEQGSPLRIELSRADLRSLTAKHNLDRNVRQRQLIPLPNAPTNGLRDYLFLTLVRTPAISHKPGGFGFDAANDLFALPVLKKVIQDVKAADGFSIRSPKTILPKLQNRVIPRMLFGHNLLNPEERP